MALEAEVRELSRLLQRLSEVLRDLGVTIGDRPPTNDSALAEGFSDTIDQLLGWLEEAQNSALEAQKAVEHPTDLDRARRALAASQRLISRIVRDFSWHLGSYDRVEGLMNLGRGRGGEWLAWAKGVKEGLERCQQALENVTQALVRCWQEIAERIGLISVSVRATNVGQQIRLTRDTEVAGDGMT